MNKTKLLFFSVITLLVLNIGTLGFLFLSRPKGHLTHLGIRPEPKEIIIAKLHFDANQKKEYDKLIQLHRNTIDELDNNINYAKNRLYLQLLKTNINVKTKDSLMNVLVNYQKQIENTHFNHFQDIKKICKPNQLEDFYDLTEELSKIFSKQRPRQRND